MNDDIKAALKLTAEAYVKENPNVGSSDKAYRELLFEFRVAFFAARKATETITPEVVE